MTSLFTKIALESKLVHKSCALLIGIGLWSVVSTLYDETVTVMVPLYFYNQAEGAKVTAPEKIAVTLRAKRTDLRTIDYTALAAHIDVQKMIADEGIFLSATNLFLPSSVKVVHYVPMKVETAMNK